MAEITAALVKDLREKSGVGMMDCKKALQENNGDIDAAMDWLRTKGLAKAAKKADRAAAEGLVAGKISADGKTGVVIELNAETDFVSKNATFQNAAREIATVALGVDGDVDAVVAAKTSKGETVGDMVTNLIATVGENMRVRRSARLAVSQGAVAVYLHNKEADDVGKMGVLVALEGAGDPNVLRDVGKRIALHVAGTPTPPLALVVDDLDPTVVAKEREIQVSMAIESGKPKEIAEKMVEGGMRKFYEEVALMEQPFVKDETKKIKDIVGPKAQIIGFYRWQVGETA